jgi:Ca-activated chloride channel homolog
MHKTGAYALTAGLLLSGLALAKGRDDDDRPPARMAPPAPVAAPAPRMSFEFSADVVNGNLGATPGGAKDIASARDHILRGEVPHPSTFTPEGLLGEHDLPLPMRRPCAQLLCLSGASTPVELLAQPEARTLAQLGFGSNIEAKTWRRDPMSIVAVVDKSGSMSGPPIETVKASLHQVVDQLGPGEQLAIVLYGDRSHVHLDPTMMRDKGRAHAAIDRIQISGSTYMEAGLKLGYEVAFTAAGHFQGRTRLMLFTDERPNVGATGKESFMAMAREASRRGVGLTTIGVGTQFGAELATAISSVRGGNLFFFPKVPDMKEKFRKDLDTMLTELAYDMKLKVRPAAGQRIVGLYGLPGDLVKRTPDGGLEMTVETIFLSRDRGGIYFSFAPEGAGALPPAPASIAAPGRAEIEYADLHGKRYRDTVEFTAWGGALPPGLARGKLLIDEITALKQATELHVQKNDQEGAYRLVRALRQRLEQGARGGVTGLEQDLRMVAKLDETLTHLSGHKGEQRAAVQRDGVSGLPR